MNCLFTVIEKGTRKWDTQLEDYCSKTVRVYDVRMDKTGFPHFLVYENNQWKYKSAKLYEPTIGN